jgi:glutamine amidotransferase-like uncharacterized protein
MIRVAVVLTAAGLISCGPREKSDILLFTGTGTSGGDTAAIGSLLKQTDRAFDTASSSRLSSMSESDLRGYKLLIVPGGNFIHMGESLNTNTAANIRGAVQNGLNYLGICAGAILAGDKGFNLTGGVRFRFYSAEDRGIRKAAVAVTGADGLTLDQYWEDGPQLSGWGAVVAKYPDGTPAITQGTVGSGWMVLTGVHPEAPERWRGSMTFATLASVDRAYAATLVRAALARTPLATFQVVK